MYVCPLRQNWDSQISAANLADARLANIYHEEHVKSIPGSTDQTSHRATPNAVKAPTTIFPAVLALGSIVETVFAAEWPTFSVLNCIGTGSQTAKSRGSSVNKTAILQERNVGYPSKIVLRGFDSCYSLLSALRRGRVDIHDSAL